MDLNRAGVGLLAFWVIIQVGQASVIRNEGGMGESLDGILMNPAGCSSLNKRVKAHKTKQEENDKNEDEKEKDYELPYVWLRQTKYPVLNHKRGRDNYFKRVNDPYVWLKKRQYDSKDDIHEKRSDSKDDIYEKRSDDPYVWLKKREDQDDPYVWLNKRSGSRDDPYVWLYKRPQDTNDPYVWLKKRGNYGLDNVSTEDKDKKDATRGPYLFLRSTLTY